MKSLWQSLSSAGCDPLLNHETNRVGADQHDCNEIEQKTVEGKTAERGHPA